MSGLIVTINCVQIPKFVDLSLHRLAEKVMKLLHSSVADPDWIRIQGGKNDLQKKGCPLLRAEGFSCSLGGLGKSKFKFSIKIIIFFSFFLLQFLVIKSLDPNLEQDSLEMLDPDPDLMNPDPQHCFLVW
jgi:hypothetical protein